MISRRYLKLLILSFLILCLTQTLKFKTDLETLANGIMAIYSSPSFSQGDIEKLRKLLEPTPMTNVSCGKLFRGDREETNKAIKIKKNSPYKPVSHKTYINATMNCQLYRMVRKYVTNVSEEETRFPLAFSILIHEKIEMFERLLRAIYRPHNYYCISVDKKSPSGFWDAVKSIVKCFDNVFLASEQEVVVYAGFSRLQADINCMGEMWNKYPDWKYVINAAGSELPLRTNLEIVRLLKEYNGLTVVENSLQVNAWRWKQKYETVIIGNKGWVQKVSHINNVPPFNLNMTKGSAYVLLSRAMVEYILTDPIPIAFLKWCNTTYSADEHFWATLNNIYNNPQLSTPGGNKCPVYAYMSRAVMWFRKKCHGETRRSICVPGAEDLPWIARRPEFFFNKLDLEVDHIAYQCVEELVANRVKGDEQPDLAIGEHRKYLSCGLNHG